MQIKENGNAYAQKTKTSIGVIAVSIMTICTGITHAEPKFAIAGAGMVSCGQYLKSSKTTKEMSDMMVVTWVQGFLSGTNTQRFWEGQKEMKLLPDAESISAFVDKYCRDNPLNNVYQASMDLERNL